MTNRERDIVLHALKSQAERLRRLAASRKYAGAGYIPKRQGIRALAREHEELAEKIAAE